ATFLGGVRIFEVAICNLKRGRGGRRYLQIVAKLTELESRLESHDADIQELVEAIRELMAPPARNGRRIGFDYTSGSPKLRGKAHGSWRHSVNPHTTSRISSSKSSSA